MEDSDSDSDKSLAVGGKDPANVRTEIHLTNTADNMEERMICS